MNGRVLLAIDLSYQTYRATAAHPMLTHGPTFTGGLYGFLTTLAKQIRETKATHVVGCRDMKPYKRSEAYPQYKQLRKKEADEELLKAFQQSMRLVLEVLEVLGIPTMAYPGFESDDCIGWLVTKGRSRYERIYAASNDSDLFQLLDHEQFAVLRQDITDVMDGRRLLKTTGLTPQQFMLASALQGTHNDIEGIPRVGEKTAARAIHDAALMRTLRERWAPVIERNLQLIKLPHSAFPRASLPEWPAAPFNHRDLYRFCGRFDIEVTKSMIDSFSQVRT